MFWQRLRVTIILLTVGLATAASCQADALDLKRLQLPEGFHIEVLSADVPGARQMALSDAGTLFVGSMRPGVVYAIGNALGETQAARVVLSDLNMPSGVTLHNNALYVGAVSHIYKAAGVDAQLEKLPAQGRLQTSVLTDQLPSETHHGWKYLGVGPDAQLYVPVGAPCNICKSEDPRFASILRMDPETGATSVYASGIRNTVGFDWHPQSGSLWFTDNGRDMLGDDIPPEELNEAPEAGLHFGFPLVHGGTIADPEFGKDADPDDFARPQVTIQAHSAALGVTFYRPPATAQEGAFPKRYAQALFIAEHGSWNRSSKVGYRVSVVTPASGGLVYEPFIEGWLQGEDNWGRPNDVLFAPDGSLLISDDQAGVIYRVHYAPVAIASAAAR